MPPIFQRETSARAIYFAAVRLGRQTWIGFPTVKTILANRVAPGLIDRFLAPAGYTGHLGETLPADAPAICFTLYRAGMRRTAVKLGPAAGACVLSNR